MKIGEEDRYNEIFTGWSPKDINIAWQMILFLRKVNVSLEEFERYAEFRQTEQFEHFVYSTNVFYLRRKIFERESEKCPECGTPMYIYPINTTRCNQIPNKRINSVWYCPDERNCGYEKFNHKDAAFYLRKLEKAFHKELNSMDRKAVLDIEVPDSFKNRGKCGG